MLTMIRLHYDDGSGQKNLDLPIKGASPKDRFLLRSVKGLNPPNRDLYIRDYARDGGTYQGRRVGVRNVVLTIDLNPNVGLGESIKSLRETLERIAMGSLDASPHIRLLFIYDDDEPREISGYTETFEAEVFDAENTVQVSIVCPDPYIRRIEGVFLQHANGWIDLPMSYPGTASVGFITTIRVNVPTSNTLTFAVDNRTMVLHHNFKEGDVVRIATMPGNRGITLLRNGVTTSIVAKLNIRSEWLTVGPSTRSLSVYGETINAKNAVFTSFAYTPLYWGA